jgi:cytochrome P450
LPGLDPDAWQGFDPIALSARPDYFHIIDERRERCPVGRSDEQGGFWVVSSHDDVLAVGQDWQTFTSTHGAGFPHVPLAPTLPIWHDPPIQRVYRRVMNPMLTAERVSVYEPGMRAVAQGLIGSFMDAGQCDLAAAYNRIYPPTVFFTVVIDVGPGEIEAMRDMSHRFSYEPVDKRVEAFHEMEAWCTAYLEQRAGEPRRDDLVDTLLYDLPQEMPIDRDDQTRALLLLIQGGFGTSANLLGAITRILCERPDIQERVRDQPTLVPALVEECLRLETPNPYMARFATKDTAIGGCRIAAGDWVLMMFAGANRDPDVFAQAGDIDLDRAVKRHLSFGVGVHRCIGSNLARLQVQIAIEELLLATDELRLQPDATVTYYGSQTRGVASMPVTFRRRISANHLSKDEDPGLGS